MENGNNQGNDSEKTIALKLGDAAQFFMVNGSVFQSAKYNFAGNGVFAHGSLVKRIPSGQADNLQGNIQQPTTKNMLIFIPHVSLEYANIQATEVNQNKQDQNRSNSAG